MPPQPKGKQGTKGKKQIHEENQQTIKIYLYIISGVNAAFYLLYYFLFWDQFTKLPTVMCVLLSAIYFGSYQFMAVIGRGKFHEGQLVDSGTDLNMKGAMAEHTKDLILLAAIVQLCALVSNYFWLLLLLAPGRAFYMLWVNFIGPWFFSPQEEEVVDEKKQKKKERKMKRQQIMMR